jgi:two-component system NtrC family sensor kinase
MMIMRSFSLKFNIQTRVALIIFIVAGMILLASTYFTQKLFLIGQKTEEEFRDRYMHIVKQVDESITAARLESLIQANPDMLEIKVFDLSSHETRFAAKAGGERSPSSINFPAATEVVAILRGIELSRLERAAGDRFWDILIPFRVEGRVAGLTQARFSTKEYDALVHRMQLEGFLITVIAAAAILGPLLLYLRRTITRPILDLVDVMHRAEAGELQSRARTRSHHTELGVLAEQFNRMLDKIETFNKELQSKVRQATEEVNRRCGELTTANKQLHETQLRLAHSRRLATAGQVASMVAHRTGTPLHSILGHLEQLKEDSTPLKREERIKVIESQVKRVVQIVQELLDLVHKPTPRMAPVQINVLLEEGANLVSPSALSRGIKIKKRFEPRLPEIMGDGSQLEEAFLNLLTNAIEAMPNGGELQVSTELHRDAAGAAEVITVQIIDTGCGIAEANLPRIFEPFFTTKESSRGTGLGLCIAKNIIELHEGRIQVKSLVGQGTSFTLTFPVNHYGTN